MNINYIQVLDAINLTFVLSGKFIHNINIISMKNNQELHARLGKDAQRYKVKHHPNKC